LFEYLCRLNESIPQNLATAAIWAGCPLGGLSAGRVANWGGLQARRPKTADASLYKIGGRFGVDVLNLRNVGHLQAASWACPPDCFSVHDARQQRPANLEHSPTSTF